jgi:hypothetical protein
MPVLTFKVSAEDAAVIRSRARALRKTVSAYLREKAVGGAPAIAKVLTKKHTDSGLSYNAAGIRTVTEREIADALADFP